MRAECHTGSEGCGPLVTSGRRPASSAVRTIVGVQTSPRDPVAVHLISGEDATLHMQARQAQQPRRGRPLKFGRPAQPVTITLPDDVVAALRSVDSDLSRAIVRIAAPVAVGLVPYPPAELSHFGRNAVIVVVRSRALERLPGVGLVPLPDGRALISLDGETGIAELDVMVRDALDLNIDSETDRAVLNALRDILRAARRSSQISLRQRSIIVLESRRTRSNHSPGRPASRGGKTT
jgi:hypothetical protein